MTELAPSIADYGLIGDCQSAALVSSDGSIDWCCLPRFDSASCFGRLLDRDRGGFCAITMDGGTRSRTSRYVDDTLVLDTRLEGAEGTIKVTDFFAMRDGGALDPRRELIRIVECVNGSAEVNVEVTPRFDYGAVRPWLRRSTAQAFTAIGGDDGLVVWSDAPLETERDSLVTRKHLGTGGQLRLLIRFVRPHLLEGETTSVDSSDSRRPPRGDARLVETLAWPHEDRRSRSGGSDPIGADPEGADLCPDGSLRGSRDDITAGDAWRGAQLGLPLQLGARLEHECTGVGRVGLRARGGRLSPFHRAQRRRSRRGSSDRLRDRGRAPPPRAGARPARLPRISAGASRQRRRRTAAAGCLRRDPEPRLALAPARPFTRR